MESANQCEAIEGRRAEIAIWKVKYPDEERPQPSDASSTTVMVIIYYKLFGVYDEPDEKVSEANWGSWREEYLEHPTRLVHRIVAQVEEILCLNESSFIRWKFYFSNHHDILPSFQGMAKGVERAGEVDHHPPAAIIELTLTFMVDLNQITLNPDKKIRIFYHNLSKEFFTRHVLVHEWWPRSFEINHYEYWLNLYHLVNATRILLDIRLLAVSRPRPFVLQFFFPCHSHKEVHAEGDIRLEGQHQIVVAPLLVPEGLVLGEEELQEDVEDSDPLPLIPLLRPRPPIICALEMYNLFIFISQ